MGKLEREDVVKIIDETIRLMRAEGGRYWVDGIMEIARQDVRGDILDEVLFPYYSAIEYGVIKKDEKINLMLITLDKELTKVVDSKNLFSYMASLFRLSLNEIRKAMITKGPNFNLTEYCPSLVKFSKILLTMRGIPGFPISEEMLPVNRCGVCDKCQEENDLALQQRHLVN